MSSTTSFGDCTDTAQLDSTKHVNFVQGMVLGVDDFRQEFAWHAGRHEMIARDLAGYGTVTGLSLAIDDNGTASPIVAVEPGLAVTPPGRFVRIKRRQCANLAQWLARAENAARLGELEEMLGSPGMRAVRVYVRLRYRECLTDDVPIPGEPCRTEEEAMAASRIADSWRLHLSFDAPAQHEEDAIRKLVRWLKLIPIVEHPAATPRQVIEALRTSATETLAASGPFPIDLVLTDPPAELVIGRDDLCACLRAALRVWTTELRPRVQERPPQGETGCGCSTETTTTDSPPSAPGVEDDLLLAELWVPVTDGTGGSVVFDSVSDVLIREGRRPYLLHLRMVQELVTCGPDATGAAAVASFASVLATSDRALLLWIHHPVELDLSAVGAIGVAVNDTDITDFAVNATGGATNVFEITLTGSPDLTLQHGDRVALAFDLNLITELEPGGGTLREALDQSRGEYLDRAGDTITVRTIVGLLALDDLVDVDTSGAANDQVLTFRDGQWVPQDVVIPAHTHALDELSDVNASAPAAGQVLTFRGAQWVAEPTQLPAHTHTLDDLSNVVAPSPASGQFLQFDGANWVPGTVTGGTSTPVHTGLVVFDGIAPGTAAWFGPFDHGLGDRVVMVRLGFEFPSDRPFELMENTDTVAGLGFPRVIAGYVTQSPQFFIFLQDPRTEGEPTSYRVRWFAIPATRQFPEVRATPLDFRALVSSAGGRAIARGLILNEVAGGSRRATEIARRFGVTAAVLNPVIEELRASNTIRVTRGIISPSG